MNVVDPPEGALWGYFNARVVKATWVTDLVKAFDDNIVQSMQTKMDVVVRRHWIEGIEKAEAIKSLGGVSIPDLPKLKLTSAGEVESPHDKLWVLGGNHRRLALKVYIEKIKAQLEKQEKKKPKKNWTTTMTNELAEATRQLRTKVESTSPYWVVALYDRGASISFRSTEIYIALTVPTHMDIGQTWSKKRRDPSGAAMTIPHGDTCPGTRPLANTRPPMRSFFSKSSTI